jgi:lipopolysaccharide/colanic/teichoic acid biosynthesis glycosyltransferase
MDSSVSVQVSHGFGKKTKKSTKWFDAFLRRTIDVVACGFGLLVLSPLFLVAAILIKKDSPGPVFYHGPRVGKGGKEFRILKFRTMYESRESYQGLKVTGNGDSRVTPIGRWLRKKKINELPQLWNVLIGDMSLVGPRPEDPEIVKTWDEDLREVILSIRPGITSPASIQFRDEEDLLTPGNLMDDYLKKILPSKLRLDTLYVQRRTILSDLDVILLTVINLLPRNRKRKVHESSLYHGPLRKLLNRHVYWFMADSSISFVMVAVTGVLWRLSNPIHAGVICAFVSALLVALIFSMINMAFGLHKVSWSSAGGVLIFDLTLSIFISTGIVMVVNELGGLLGYLPPALLIMSSLLSFIGFVAVRYRSRILGGVRTRFSKLSEGSKQLLKERVLIVGAGELGGIASWLINHGDFARAFSVVGFLDDDPSKVGMMVDGAPVLGMTTELVEIIEKHDVALVVFAITRISDSKRKNIIRLCQNTGTNYFVFPRLFDLMMSSLNSETLAPKDVTQYLDTIAELIRDGKTHLALDEIDQARSSLATTN